MRDFRFALIFSVILSAATVACSQPPSGDSIDLGAPNASGQKAAFVGQTRAPQVKSKTAFEVTVVAGGLSNPWAVEPLPNGSFLVTEKRGQMRIVSAKGEVSEPIDGLLPVGEGNVSAASGGGGLPPISARGQGGLMDVALSPTFAKDRTIFWSFTEQREGGSGTSVARGVLSADQRNITEAKVIFRALPTFDNPLHFGSRIAFGPDGMLYLTLGDRFNKEITRPQAQKLDSHAGKVVRIKPDGTIPADNPFVNEKGALPEIWDIGHRNIQSATFDDKGRLWTVEHGPQGGDELNLVEKGKNYGWPVISYGEEYSGDAIDGNITAKEGMEQPVYYWDPVIAPSGAQYYTGKLFPEWQGSIFIGGLATTRLVRVIIKGTRVVGEEHLLTDRGKRIRDVRQGNDGELYVVTDESDGELLKITPVVKKAAKE